MQIYSSKQSERQDESELKQHAQESKASIVEVAWTTSETHERYDLAGLVFQATSGRSLRSLRNSILDPMLKLYLHIFGHHHWILHVFSKSILHDVERIRILCKQEECFS